MPNLWLMGVISWAALTTAVVVLAIYRNIVARGECDVLHIRESEFSLVPRQAEFAHRLDTIDFWGKLLTLAATCYGLILVAMFLYQVWIQSNS